VRGKRQQRLLVPREIKRRARLSRMNRQTWKIPFVTASISMSVRHGRSRNKVRRRSYFLGRKSKAISAIGLPTVGPALAALSIHGTTMKVGEFARRARAHRLPEKNDVETACERARRNRRLFDPATAGGASAVKFLSETKCRAEALIPYPQAVSTRRR